MSYIGTGLSELFDSTDVEWRIGRSGQGWAKALAYITNRAIMERLDDVVGVANWKNEYVKLDNGILCGLSLKIDGEWVTKWDGAEPTHIESFKGGLSASMKRTAVQWGIGRYLYKFDETWVEYSTDKKDGWNYGKAKNGGAFYWKTPELPAWANPIGTNKVLSNKLQSLISTITNPELIDRAKKVLAMDNPSDKLLRDAIRGVTYEN